MHIDNSAHRVLIVDSSPDSASVLTRLFEVAGHWADAAYSEKGALVAAAAEPFDLVLCDLDITGERDTGLGAKLRAQLPPQARLVGVTRDTRDGDAAFTASAGFDELIARPALLDRLSSQLAAG